MSFSPCHIRSRVTRVPSEVPRSVRSITSAILHSSVGKALVTGSAGLIGSACVRTLASEDWDVIGLDNDMRHRFFGPEASTAPVLQSLLRDVPRYRHRDVDIRNRQLVRDVIAAERPDFAIHTAAQPSHDKAASIPYDDFDVNAGGTLNLLVAMRDYCRASPFAFLSTNKVYGDRPNTVPIVELETRYDYVGLDGVDESMPIDNTLHSLFGASKLAADILCQEFGRYFDMPVGVFRAGCLTGPQHAAVELHGYLAYIVNCAVRGNPYTDIRVQGQAGPRSASFVGCCAADAGVLPPTAPG